MEVKSCLVSAEGHLYELLQCNLVPKLQTSIFSLIGSFLYSSGDRHWKKRSLVKTKRARQHETVAKEGKKMPFETTYISVTSPIPVFAVLPVLLIPEHDFCSIEVI